MTVKEFILRRVQLFFLLTTMILIAQAVIGTIVEPGETLRGRYLDLLTPLWIAALCIVPTVVTYSRKKLTCRQMLIRHAIQLVLIEGVMFVIAYTNGLTDPKVLLLIAAAVFVIYGFCIFILWLGQLRASKRMTEQLRKLQQQG